MPQIRATCRYPDTVNHVYPSKDRASASIDARTGRCNRYWLKSSLSQSRVQNIFFVKHFDRVAHNSCLVKFLC